MQRLIEQILEQLPWTMGIGIGKGGLVGGRLDTQVPQFSQTAGQAGADLAQTLGLGYLAKQHGYKLVPGT
jgi:hypothetical protein